MKTILKFSFVSLLLQALTSHATLTVTNIAQGSMALHSLFLKSDGSLWAMGFNSQGQLGDGTYATNGYLGTNFPEQIVASNVTTIAVGGFHSLFVKSDGSLWATGNGFDGQLGDGRDGAHTSSFNTNRPEEIVSNNVTAVAAGTGHSLFLKSDGSLWAMGFGNYGQLGDGTFDVINRPEEILTNGVMAIAAGEYHSLFIETNGSLWAMGWDESGQLGDGIFETNSPYGADRPEQIVASNVTAIAAGAKHSLFLKSDGSLWAMGDNTYGELGDGSWSSTNRPEQIVPSGVKAITAGSDYSLFIKSDGSLWAMGDDGDRQLGDGAVPRGFGDPSEYSTNLPEQILAGNVTAVAAGYDHTLFIKSDGSLWAVGNDGNGELGDGFGFFAFLPEQIFPLPQPVLSIALLSPTDLQFNATCGFSGTFYLLASTNLALPLSQWTPVGTNILNDGDEGPDNFSLTLPNAVNPGKQQFYILQSPGP